MYNKFLVYDMPTELPVLKQMKCYTVSSQPPKWEKKKKPKNKKKKKNVILYTPKRQSVLKKKNPWTKKTVWRKKYIINVVYRMKHQIMKKIAAHATSIFDE